jgi:hypothetical protein
MPVVYEKQDAIPESESDLFLDSMIKSAYIHSHNPISQKHEEHIQLAILRNPYYSMQPVTIPFKPGDVIAGGLQ